MFGILLCAFLGGSASWLYLQQKCVMGDYFQTTEDLVANVIGSNSLPILFAADIDTLAEGLKRNEFTSVDLVKACHLAR